MEIQNLIKDKQVFSNKHLEQIAQHFIGGDLTAQYFTGIKLTTMRKRTVFNS